MNILMPFCIYICHNVNTAASGYIGHEYVFYYESHRYHLTNHSNIINTFPLNSNANISIHIAPNDINHHFLYINHHPLVHNYQSDNEFNEIQMFESTSSRRRLRTCKKQHCVSGACHTHTWSCRNIAPPKSNSYWVRRYKRSGRFVAVNKTHRTQKRTFKIQRSVNNRMRCQNYMYQPHK
eukprot:945778_1